ncbi:hypothetical protein EVG20_g5811 [Dentipellis fragilis]|uniref:tRNA-splicing endonuclease subunit Sen54 N-terminal domain-containing protein n=1 Tax=Dentipellis fragilis TaxID=205917 RepID=A0A4Y9YSW1_9AGAM|nr:hypothetical protein EVG20_g5811 [Dentipellis fragilis]
MDDSLEEPMSTDVLPSRPDNVEEDEQSSGDEDGGLDWTKLPSSFVHKPVIPKRGEKDFEPAPGGGSGLQTHNLDRARTAMFNALGATRAISSKSVSYAIWHPSLSRAHVTLARGTQFNALGHSVARNISALPESKARKRLELLPEEALYLVEKGSVVCWKEIEGQDFLDVEKEDALQGAPMSVQQAFAEMIGKEDLTLERYQVFSYLKRLGYNIMRAHPPSSSYPLPSPYPITTTPSHHPSFLERLFSPISRILQNFLRPVFDWWRPLTHRRWLHHNMDNLSIFKSLRFLSSGHSVPLKPPPAAPTVPPSPYKVFYHLYKPNTPFKKTSPPPPDFSVVVVNARTTPMPTLAEFTDLFGNLPTVPPPLPRQRNRLQNKSAAPPTTPQIQEGATTSKPEPAPPSQPTWLARLAAYIPFLHCGKASQTPPAKNKPGERRVNPFMALRQGNKIVIVAAVDAGVASFFRFGEGSFDEWPMA